MTRRNLVPASRTSRRGARSPSGTRESTTASPGRIFTQEQPVSSIFQFGRAQASVACNPDTPLPSVERDFHSTTSGQHTPSTPPVTVREAFSQNGLAEDSVAGQLDALRDLRLSTPNDPDTPLQGARSTPSICVTPAASPFNFSFGDASVFARFGALHITANNNTAGKTDSRSRETSSPSPARRRQSGSGINRKSHQLEDEVPLPAPFNTTEVQKALSDTEACMSKMVKALSSSHLHLEDGSGIQNLHQQALNLLNQQLPSSRIVGLVGDSGVGKSSLINSLLDVEFARASGNGAACTCAVTEYMYHSEDTFKIQVDYFTSDELKKQYEELLRAYRDYEELPEASRQPHVSDEGQSATGGLKTKAHLATQTFSTIFREKLGTNPTILSTMDFDRAIGLMVEWTAHLLPKSSDYELYRTTEECSARLKDLTSELEKSSTLGKSTARWPLIRRLRVYLNAYILSKGLIIADLPGLRDHNSSRKAITERYIRQCHQIFAVATIERPITNESVKEIFELARRADLSKIDVVCTRAEDIQFREARYDWVAERARIEELDDAIDEASKDAASLKEMIKDLGDVTDGLTRDQQHDLGQWIQNLQKAERSEQTNKLERFKLIVGLRNAKISDGMQAQYKDHPAASLLKTFCVSNTAYWKYRHKPGAISQSYLQLSGIIQLRQYCIGIVAESRLRVAVHYVKDQVPAFLASVGLWVEAGSGSASAEKKQQVLDTVSALEKGLSQILAPASEVKQSFNGLMARYTDKVDRPIANSRQWSHSAARASMNWQDWHHSSYKAFCSRYGDHCTYAAGSYSWNTEAMAHMKRDMKNVWRDLASDSEDYLSHVLAAVEHSFDIVIRLSVPGVRSGSGIAHDSRSMMRSLEDILHHRKDLALHGLEDAIEEFRQKLLSLKVNALAPTRTAFIGRCMEDTYHAANMEYGPGSDRRRKHLVTRRFGSEELFNDYRAACKAGFKHIARSLQTKATEAVSRQIQLVEADLQILRDENVVLECERNPEFRKRVETELNASLRDLDRAQRAVSTV